MCKQQPPLRAGDPSARIASVATSTNHNEDPVMTNDAEDDRVELSGPCPYSRRRRLLTAVEYSLHPGIVQHVFPQSPGGSRDVLDPLIVKCSSPKASFSLAFDKRSTDADNYNVDVEVRDMDAPNVTLQIEVTVEWYKRPPGENVSWDTDKSKWPAPEPRVKVTLDGEGHIASFLVDTLRALTVHLEVYSVENCLSAAGLLGGLNALRLEETLSDVELRVDGVIFPAHRAVLAAYSSVFHRMFTSGLKEAADGVVEVEGTSSTAFGLFLQFLYSGTVGDWKGCEIELLDLASRYLVEQLQCACEQRLLQMNWSTALVILQHADNKPVIASSDLRKQAVRVVVHNWDAVHSTQAWEDFQAACPALADAVLVAQQSDAERKSKHAEWMNKVDEWKNKEDEWKMQGEEWKIKEKEWTHRVEELETAVKKCEIQIEGWNTKAEEWRRIEEEWKKKEENWMAAGQSFAVEVSHLHSTLAKVSKDIKKPRNHGYY